MVYEEFGSPQEDFDLSRILNNNQQSNLDDFIHFDIFFDFLQHQLPEECNSERSRRHLSTFCRESSLLDRLAEVYAIIEIICSNYAWTCCPLLLEIVPAEVESSLTSSHEYGLQQDCKNVCSTDRMHASPLSSKQQHYCNFIPSHIAGHIRVGDNIEEEWLIIRILQNLSSSIQDISISVNDADGEILLIESAMNLPSWITPQTSKNRVWIRHGCLHLIPKSFPSHHSINNVGEFDPSPITIQQAIQYLISNQKNALAKPALQRSILRKTKIYSSIIDEWNSTQDPTDKPSLIKEAAASLCRKHKSRIVVPIEIALLLQKYPHLLGIALDHLPPPTDIIKQYTIQKDKQKRINPDDNMPNESSSSVVFPQFDCSLEGTQTVCILVSFNRCQVARLKSLRFRIPASFTVAQWRFPLGNSSDKNRHLSKDEMRLRGAVERGAKICLGLLCAFIANERGVTTSSSLRSFFWSHVEDMKHSPDSIKCRLATFYDLLERSKKPSGSSLPVSTVNDLVDHFSSIPQKHIDPTNSQMDFESIRFEDVFRSAYLESMRTVADNPNFRFCNCWNIADTPQIISDDADGFNSSSTDNKKEDWLPKLSNRKGCFGTFCCEQSDTEDWLELSQKEVEDLIESKQIEDRYRDMIERELRQTTSCDTQTSPNLAPHSEILHPPLQPRDKENDFSNLTSAQSDSVLSPSLGQSKEDLRASRNDTMGLEKSQKRCSQNFDLMTAKSDELMTNFAMMLDAKSGLEGVELPISSKREKLCHAAKIRLRDKLPDEFLDLLDDYESSDAGNTDDETSISNTSSESWGAARLRELENENDGDLDDEMKQIMHLMDQELKEYSQIVKKSNRYRQSEDMTESKHEIQGYCDYSDDDDMAVQRDNVSQRSTSKGYRIPFRAKSPAEMSELDLATTLGPNLIKSQRQEGFLEPGPASLLLKSLEQISGK